MTDPHALQRHGLPLDALNQYLTTAAPQLGVMISAEKFKGGQSNPTYRIQTETSSLVLRRKPSGPILASAHAVDREYRVLQALSRAAIPVAQPLLLCEDTEVIGSVFYLMEYVDGVVYWDPALPELDVSLRDAHYRQAIEVMARIHAVDIDAAGLRDFGRPGNYFSRQIRRWSDQYRASETRTIDAMEQLLNWLPAHCPAESDLVSLVHGDYRFDNLMFARGRPEVMAVMDWELSTLGHPLADLGYLCMALRLPRQAGTLAGLAGLDRGALGIPDEDTLIGIYTNASGRSPDGDWAFHLAFNFFRLAAIAQGVYKRACQGNASSEQALAAGAMAEVVAAMGADCIP